MDVVKAVETYITKLVSEPSSMKVLLLDGHTVGVLRVDHEQNAKLLAHTDPNCLISIHAVDPLVTASIPHGQDRQPEPRSHITSEVCMFLTD